MEYVEERFQHVTLILKEATKKEEAITMIENKLPVVANVINEACVSSNSLNGKDHVTGSNENLAALRILGSHGKQVSSVVVGSQDIGIKIDPKIESSSETLSIHCSHDEKDCHSHPNRFVAVMEQGGQELNADMVQTCQANFKSGWVDSDTAQGGKGKHKDTKQMGIHAAGVKLECVKKGGLKKGRWTRLSSKVGVKFED